MSKSGYTPTDHSAPAAIPCADGCGADAAVTVGGTRRLCYGCVRRRLTATGIVLRGVVGGRFGDGGWRIEIDGGHIPGHPGPRFLHLRADELRAEVGQRVTLRIEVERG